MVYVNLPGLRGHQDPSRPTCSFTRHPVLETKDSDDSWWFTELGQDGDTAHCQLQKISKTPIYYLDVVVSLQRTSTFVTKSWHLPSLVLPVIITDPGPHICGQETWDTTDVQMLVSTRIWKPEWNFFCLCLIWNKFTFIFCKIWGGYLLHCYIPTHTHTHTIGNVSQIWFQMWRIYTWFKWSD